MTWKYLVKIRSSGIKKKDTNSEDTNNLIPVRSIVHEVITVHEANTVSLESNLRDYSAYRPLRTYDIFVTITDGNGNSIGDII